LKDTERVFSSTTFVWRKVKISPAPQAQGTARAKRAPLASKVRRRKAGGLPKERPAGVLVQYRAGAECWWEITYAGERFRIQGYHDLHSVMAWIFEGRERPRQSKSPTIGD